MDSPAPSPRRGGSTEHGRPEVARAQVVPFARRSGRGDAAGTRVTIKSSHNPRRKPGVFSCALDPLPPDLCAPASRGLAAKRPPPTQRPRPSLASAPTVYSLKPTAFPRLSLTFPLLRGAMKASPAAARRGPAAPPGLSLHSCQVPAPPAKLRAGPPPSGPLPTAHCPLPTFPPAAASPSSKC
jgi:hypothetical protein